MNSSRKKILSYSLITVLIVGIIGFFILGEDTEVESEETIEDEVHLTILGTTDVHGNIYNWSYEDEEEDDRGLAKIATIVDEVREENPNTLLIDNGDMIQGTILTDDLYNLNPDEPNPMIDVMNLMEYDSMTLGNHEFNFGLETIDKLIEEANFPILAANMYKKDGSNYTKPYEIVEKGGIKIGIIGLTHWNIHQWDGPKVKDIEFERAKDELPKYIGELENQVDIIIATVHEGLESDEDGIDLKDAIADNPEISAFLVGHDHETVEEYIGDMPVGGARDQARELVRFDLFLERGSDEDDWEVKDSDLEIIETEEYDASQEVLDQAEEYHENTLAFIKEPIGQSTGDFHPEPEVKGIPEAQLRDTGLINLINKVQIENTGADISAASLFDIDSNIAEGDISYKDLFNVYRYSNTLVGIEMTGEQFKNYMEWTSEYYNQYEDGDVTISFNSDMRPYNYDNFMGVEYKIDISQPEGERVQDLTRDGEPIEDDEILKVAVNSHKYGELVTRDFVTEDPYYFSDPVSLRSLIADYIEEKGTIEPETEENWEVIGADLDHPLRDWIINEVNEDRLEILREDERTFNSESLNVYKLIEEEKIPSEVLEEHDLDADGNPL